MNEPAPRLDSNGVPFPPDPDPSSGNLAGITPEQLAADRIAKYREVLGEEAAPEAGDPGGIVRLASTTDDLTVIGLAIVEELKALREAVQRIEERYASTF